MEKKRIWTLDNLKVILIFLVVFGHLLELTMNEKIKFIYVTIYFFHMPAFAFCSGYFSKQFDAKKIVTKMVVPYIIFQTIYCIFNSIYLNNSKEITLDYVKPYWIMWYLFATIIWNIILQFFYTHSIKKQIIIVIGLFVLGLLARLRQFNRLLFKFIKNNSIFTIFCTRLLY